MNKIIISIYLICFFITGCENRLRVLSKNLKTDKGVTFFNGEPFSGISYDKFNDSLNKELTHYLRGKKDGESIFWYPNQQIKEIYFYSNGNKIGTQTGYFHDGALRFKKIYNFNGLLNGKQLQWHSNKILARLSNYREGKEDGLQMGWRFSGDLKHNYQIVNNKRYGYMGSKICVPIDN